MKKLRDTIGVLAVAVVLCANVVHAQGQGQGSQTASPASPLPPADTTGSTASSGSGKAPAAAARGVSGGYDDSNPYDPSQVMPDSNTLAGAQLFGLGSLEHVHNVFSPSIIVSELGQITPGATGQATLSSESVLNGSLSFDRNWGVNEMIVAYVGGETFTMGAITSHTPFQELSFSQQMNWARWHVIIRDDFTDSPGAAFTGTGMGGPGLIAAFSNMLGTSLSSIGQSFMPSETIQTGNATRYRNSILGQAEYSFSRRSAFTFAGSYGLLEFPGAGYVSSHMLNAQGGYDYLLDPSDSVAILASYGKIDYTGTSNSSSVAGSSTTDYMAALAFGRKITGHIAFQVGAGPQQIRVVSPALTATGNFQLWFLSVNSALSYERRRSGISLTYARGLGAGSGVYLGATSNTITGTWHYQFTRAWNGSVLGGYALNNSLAPAGVATSSFNNWFLGANFGRQVGRHAQVNFNYGLQRQSTPAACPVISCGGTGFQQTFGMTVNYHLF